MRSWRGCCVPKSIALPLFIIKELIPETGLSGRGNISVVGEPISVRIRIGVRILIGKRLWIGKRLLIRIGLLIARILARIRWWWLILRVLARILRILRVAVRNLRINIRIRTLWRTGRILIRIVIGIVIASDGSRVLRNGIQNGA